MYPKEVCGRAQRRRLLPHANPGWRGGTEVQLHVWLLSACFVLGQLEQDVPFLKMISGQFLQMSLPGKQSPGRVMEDEAVCTRVASRLTTASIRGSKSFDNGFDTRAGTKDVAFPAFGFACVVGTGAGGAEVEGRVLPAPDAAATGG